MANYYYYTNDRSQRCQVVYTHSAAVVGCGKSRLRSSCDFGLGNVFFFYFQTRHFHLFQLYNIMVGTSSGDGVGAVAGGESQTRRAITT